MVDHARMYCYGKSISYETLSVLLEKIKILNGDNQTLCAMIGEHSAWDPLEIE